MLKIITLFFALSLILTAAQAHIDTPIARQHSPGARRLIKKRSILGFGNNNAAAPEPNASNGQNGAVNAAPNPSDSGDAANPTNVQQPTNNQPSATGKSQPAATGNNTPTSPPASAPTASANGGGNGGGGNGGGGNGGGILGPILTPILGGNQPANTSASASTSTSTSSSTSSSTASTSATPFSSTSLTPTLISTPTDTSANTGPVQVTVTSSASPSATSAAAESSGSVTKLQRNTIIILVAIGASIGAAGIIWTIIRKWKFRPSSSFEDRMQPIDWQPTTAPHDDRDITEKLNRSGSTRSHGSFTSGNHNHDNLAPDLPAHDFTAGPAHLAPVGGYADLQRGPSPQPDYRSASPYQYDIPNPHGQYYNNGGAYQGGYDHSRGY